MPDGTRVRHAPPPSHGGHQGAHKPQSREEVSFFRESRKGAYKPDPEELQEISDSTEPRNPPWLHYSRRPIRKLAKLWEAKKPSRSYQRINRKIIVVHLNGRHRK